MKKILTVLYGVGGYALGVGSLVYLIGFVGNIAVPKSIDTGVQTPLIQAVIINLALIAIFSIQHSIMARPGFKQWWTRMVPPPVERSTYVWIAGLLMSLIMWQWRPIPGQVWQVGNSLGITVLMALFWIGWVTAFAATFMINHFDLFGLRQVYLSLREQPYTHPEFQTKAFYKLLRHPIMLGFLIAFWSAPTMTVSRFVFAMGFTVMVLIGIYLEERDLAEFIGPEYARYRSEVPMLVPRLPKTKGGFVPGQNDTRPG